jgi:uncharacterized protein YaaW (UPF0174 family)
MPSLITDPDLALLLDSADVEDLTVLIDHITDKGEGRISLLSASYRALRDAKAAGQIDGACRALIAEELQRFGGNSVANLLRGGAGISYREILRDVASHVSAKTSPKSDCVQFESAIVDTMMDQAFAKMTEQEREDLFSQFGAKYTSGAGPAAMAALQVAIRASGFGAFKLAAIVANAVARAILGRGLAFGATAGLMRGIGAFAGPIGWAVTAVWTVFDLASPAYRVTLPCVIQLAYIRQKALLLSCPRCHAPTDITKNFCGECGSPLRLQITYENAGSDASTSAASDSASHQVKPNQP